MTKATAHSPERTCIVTRVQKHPNEMLRFVLSPEDVVTPDIKSKLPGRGVYVSTNAANVRVAVKKNAFAKAFKQKVEVSASLDAEIDRLLETAALQAFSIANKAGALVAGFAKIESALTQKKVIAVVHASDGAQDGTRKLSQVVRRAGAANEEAKPIADLRCFTIAQLEQALGKDNVIHAAILSSDAGRFFVNAANRLQKFRATTTPQETQENFCDSDEICDKADEISAE